MTKKLIYSPQEKRYIEVEDEPQSLTSEGLTSLTEEEITIDQLIDSLKVKELSHVMNGDNFYQNSAGFTAIMDYNPDDNNHRAEDAEDQDHKKLGLEKPKIVITRRLQPLLRVFKPNRIDLYSERHFPRRSYYDQYLLERAWYYLANKVLTQDIILKPEYFERSDVLQEPKTKVASNSDSEIPLSKSVIEEITKLEEVENQECIVDSADSSITGLSESENKVAPQIAIMEESSPVEDLTEINHTISVYLLNDGSYILPMSKSGIPGAYWGSGKNEDFTRPIEAIELFRLPGWTEEEYSYKIFFSPETYLLTTLITKNGPTCLEEVLPCGLEFFMTDFVRMLF